MPEEVDIFSLPIEIDEEHEKGNASIHVDKIKCHPDDYKLLVEGLAGLRGNFNENTGTTRPTPENPKAKE